MARARAFENLPLLGIPFGLKDNIDVEGMPTIAACPAFSYMPQRSAKSVERLIAAGAICLGKTNLDQSGLSGARSPYGSCASLPTPSMFREAPVPALLSRLLPAMSCLR